MKHVIAITTFFKYQSKQPMNKETMNKKPILMTSFPLTLRQSCLWIHRYTGLAMAAFLIIAGITGTLLAFHDELDDVFNHKLANIDAQHKPPLPIATLHDAVISAYPQYQFSPKRLQKQKQLLHL